MWRDWDYTDIAVKRIVAVEDRVVMHLCSWADDIHPPDTPFDHRVEFV